MNFLMVEVRHKHSVLTHNHFRVIQLHISKLEEKNLLRCFLVLKRLLYFLQDINSHYNKNQNKAIERCFYNKQLLALKQITYTY